MTTRLGILGCGWIGYKRLKALCASGVATVAAIVEPNTEASLLAQGLAGEAALYESVDQLFDLGLDGIVISTPNDQHANQAQQALNNGVAVFCQKPIGRNTVETAAVIEAAYRADRLIAADFCYRFTTGMQRIRETISAGVLGKLYAVDLCFHNSFGPDKTWYYDATHAGGGCVLDLGIHLIDLALWILGFPEVGSVSSRLFAHGTSLCEAALDAVEDYAVASLDLIEPVHITMTCSWNQPTGGDSLMSAVFRGTQGAAEFRNVNGSFYDFRADCYLPGSRQNLSQPPDDWGGRALVHWASRLGRSNRFSAEAFELVRLAEIVDRIYLSRTRG